MYCLLFLRFENIVKKWGYFNYVTDFKLKCRQANNATGAGIEFDFSAAEPVFLSRLRALESLRLLAYIFSVILPHKLIFFKSQRRNTDLYYM